MPKLHQINLQYDPVQDRILLRLRTRAGDQFPYWLTRRFVKALWPVLVGALKRHETVERQSDDRAKDAVLAFRHQAAIAGSNFGTPFQSEDPSYPQGEDPRLLYKAEIKPHGGQHNLALHPKEGQGIQIALSEALLHSLCRLLADATEKAGWKLGLGISGATAPDRPSGPLRLN